MRSGNSLQYQAQSTGRLEFRKTKRILSALHRSRTTPKPITTKNQQLHYKKTTNEKNTTTGSAVPRTVPSYQHHITDYCPIQVQSQLSEEKQDVTDGGAAGGRVSRPEEEGRGEDEACAAHQRIRLCPAGPQAAAQQAAEGDARYPRRHRYTAEYKGQTETTGGVVAGVGSSRGDPGTLSADYP